MSVGLERARSLAQAAKGEYASRKAEAESAVVRWQWATGPLYSYEPAHFEISRDSRGRVLAAEPSGPVDGSYGYGFDAHDRVVVERQHTEFAGRVYETFFKHESDGISSIRYEHAPEKDWINAKWFVNGAPGIVEAYGVYALGSWVSETYEYDNLGRLVRCRRKGPNRPYGEVDDTYDLEYDATGRIVRVYWTTPHDRHLSFERPPKEATLRVCRPVLLAKLSEAIVEAMGAAPSADPAYAVVLSFCEAEYQHRLPPHVGIGRASERERLTQQHGRAASDYVWNPAEWASPELELQLPPALSALCDSVNQDIWQNELFDETDRFLADLAKAVRKAPPPGPVTEDFVSVVVALDAGDFGAQVAAQADKKIARRLRLRGVL